MDGFNTLALTVCQSVDQPPSNASSVLPNAVTPSEGYSPLTPRALLVQVSYE